jgi:hypothetical protein
VAVCFYHGDRPGVGVCMRCRRPICAACCTRLDGVNHCHACLKVLGTRPEPVRRALSLQPLLRGLLLALGWGVVFFLLWCLQGRLVP